MKHIYSFLIGVLLTICSAGAQSAPSKGITAQYEDYSWKPLTGNYVATDYKGVTHDIQAYLAEGKCVLIDFSATNCEPCWKLHQQGYLEKYHNLFGPNGTEMQRLVVLWVEVYGAPWDKIKDPYKDWTKIHNSTDDVSYPILSEREMDKKLGIQFNSVPSVFLISPHNEYTEIYQTGILYSETRLKELINACPKLPQAPKAVQAYALETAYTGEQIAWTPIYESIAPITSYAWTFEGANTPSSSEQNPVAVWDTPGTYKVQLTLQNIKGSTTAERTYTVLDRKSSTLPINEDAENGTLPKGWRTWEEDGDFKSWSNLKMDLDRLGLTIPENYKGGYNSPLCWVSWSFYPTSGTVAPNGGFNLKGTNVAAQNWLISPPISIPEKAVKASISYTTNRYFLSKPDHYQLLASTESTLASHFTHVLKEGQVTHSKEWQNETIDLMPFKGKTVTLAFVHKRMGNTSSLSPGSSFLLDNIKIEVEVSSATLPALPEEEVSIFPTESSTQITVRTPEKSQVRIFDPCGKLLYYTESASEEFTLNVTDWQTGRYFVQVVTPDKQATAQSFYVKH
ncbi:hypothetical protein HQ36_01455 [Porphyromonas gingivicanis]|uniref:PKD domain-containing protein n=1 Tax=Porphyromonas gingivicanis TaxID=266762 RepID=A0A0A2G9P0_9PORP|nr:choice-of-anchor J domain-containing protein [Porphyromonas gingivicanis]KGN99152.1 hypothetical protein HQ36_01455 [Porphyromonas gingivicanis]